MMNEKEKLIDILECIGDYDVTANSEMIADHLIANDVTVRDKGEWVNPYINRYGHPCHCCSVCGFKASYQDKNFCPNCGADMRGAEHETD